MMSDLTCELCGQPPTAEYPTWRHRGGQNGNGVIRHQDPDHCLAAAIARADALAAEVARLTAELANRPPGYLAALDARDEAHRCLYHVMSVLGLVINNTTCNEVVAAVERLTADNAALAAEVDRLRAERHQLHRDWSTARDEIDDFRAECAALRAQLAAAQWRLSATEKPAAAGVEVDVRATGLYDEAGWSIYIDGDIVASYSHHHPCIEWRPKPPQE